MSTSLATSVVEVATSALTTMRRGVDRLDHAVALGHHRDARVAGHDGLHAGADQRRLGAEERHRLALHVRAHEGAVGVVVLQEGDERGGHRDELVGRHVHQVDLLRADLDELALLAAGDGVARRSVPFLSTGALAWAMVCFSSSSAE